MYVCDRWMFSFALGLHFTYLFSPRRNHVIYSYISFVNFCFIRVLSPLVCQNKCCYFVSIHPEYYIRITLADLFVHRVDSQGPNETLASKWKLWDSRGMANQHHRTEHLENGKFVQLIYWISIRKFCTTTILFGLNVHEFAFALMNWLFIGRMQFDNKISCQTNRKHQLRPPAIRLTSYGLLRMFSDWNIIEFYWRAANIVICVELSRTSVDNFDRWPPHICTFMVVGGG